MTAMDRIEINPDVMMGKPVIRGTRIPVELILRKLSEGATEADLLDAYPRLTLGVVPATPAPVASSVATQQAPRCYKCGREMVLKENARGKFWACPGFPKCRNTFPARA